MSRPDPDSYRGLLRRIGDLSAAILQVDLQGGPTLKDRLAKLRELQTQRARLLAQVRRDYADRDPLKPRRGRPRRPAP